MVRIVAPGTYVEYFDYSHSLMAATRTVAS